MPVGSFLTGATLRELRFRQRFNATVLALNRTNSTLCDRLGRVVLREGDILLQAPLDALRVLQLRIVCSTSVTASPPNSCALLK